MDDNPSESKKMIEILPPSRKGKGHTPTPTGPSPAVVHRRGGANDTLSPVSAPTASASASGQAYQLTPSDVVIGVMGLTGSGKTTLTSLLTEQDIKVGHGLKSCTSEVEIYCCFHSGQKIYLVDTPGFNDTYRSDTDVLKDVAYYLSTLYTHKIRLAGMIYLHSITDQRMTGSALKNLHMFERLCGKKSLPSILLATTKWDLLEKADKTVQTGINREKELLDNQNFWGYMAEGGSKVVRHDGSSKSAWDLVSYLAERKQSVVLEIQRQMVDERQTLDDTAAGHFVKEELIKAREQHERGLQDLKEGMEYARREKDHAMAMELQKLQQKHEAEIAATYRAGEDLKINLQNLVEERSQQYEKRLRDFEAERQERDRQLLAKTDDLDRVAARLNDLERERKQQSHQHEQRIEQWADWVFSRFF